LVLGDFVGVKEKLTSFFSFAIKKLGSGSKTKNKMMLMAGSLSLKLTGSRYLTGSNLVRINLGIGFAMDLHPLEENLECLQVKYFINKSVYQSYT
jgi:hypothetical protein